MMAKEIMAIGMRNGIGWATDDVSGAALNPESVKKARAEEMEFFKRMGVYIKVPRWMARGKKVIRTRWVDVNKGDEANPDLRSRLVGKEFADGVDPNLYAATPPIEPMRYIISKAATGDANVKKLQLMTNDVRRAYFHAAIEREVYVEMPSEDKVEGEGDVVGRLKMCLVKHFENGTM